jgi:hypothetical protein
LFGTTNVVPIDELLVGEPTPAIYTTLEVTREDDSETSENE